MTVETSKVYDAYGRLMMVSEWETDELFDIEEDETRDFDGDWRGVQVKPLPKAPKCKPCRICKIKHFSSCHKCPHVGTLKDYKRYEDSPCADCGAPSESLKNGHGKVFVYDDVAHGKAYIPYAPIESDENYVAILDTLRGFASLTPQEFSVFIQTKYFSKTYLQAGKELEEDFKGSYGKNKVVSLLQSAEEKLSEVLHAGKIIRGKIAGTGNEGNL